MLFNKFHQNCCCFGWSRGPKLIWNCALGLLRSFRTLNLNWTAYQMERIFSFFSNVLIGSVCSFTLWQTHEFYLSRFLNLLAKKTFFRWNKVSSLPKAVELEPIIVLLSIVIRFNQKPKDQHLAKEKNPATTNPPLLGKFFKEKNPLCIEVCMAVANFSLFAQISNKTISTAENLFILISLSYFRLLYRLQSVFKTERILNQ